MEIERTEGNDRTYQAKGDGTGDAQILSLGFDLSVDEHENHGEQRADDLRND
jgi:hypothetical protein